MKKYAVLHEPGDIVTLAGTRFVVLDVERRGSLPDSLFLLALESVGASEFGSSNNYAESDFYPRPPRGGRQPYVDVVDARHLFLSTPSARRATIFVR